MTRVLLADDHPMIGAALEVLLRGTDYELVGRAKTGSDALGQVQRLKPDILLLDVHMPDGTGLDVLRQLRLAKRAPAIVMLTAGMNDPQLLAADKLAPEAIVLKTSDPALLLDCMDQIQKGERFIDPEIADRLQQANERAERAPSLISARTGADRPRPPGSAKSRHRFAARCDRGDGEGVSARHLRQGWRGQPHRACNARSRVARKLTSPQSVIRERSCVTV